MAERRHIPFFRRDRRAAFESAVSTIHYGMQSIVVAADKSVMVV
jgi:hypothetical protein